MMATEADVFFNLMFGLIVYVFVYPPKEFVDIGLSVDQLATKFQLLPEQSLNFIDYHRKRTSLNRVLHAAIPGVYVLLYNIQFEGHQHFVHNNGFVLRSLWTSIEIASVLLLLVVAAQSVYWWRGDKHPLVGELRKYCGDQHQQQWASVATNINDEFRRADKIVFRVSTITSVVATENWVIRTSPYEVRIAHQSDTALIVVKSETHAIGQDARSGSDEVQYVNIIVKPTRRGVAEFAIRLNALDFANLQDRVNRPITILSGVNFSRTLVDRFVDAFKECVQNNPKYDTDQEFDSCFACMQAIPNVKLQRNCGDTNAAGALLPADERCGSCFCRPMWCLDCLAKWFASRQDPNAKELWLEQKCSCPMCRTKFCMHDICLVNRV